jgi:hypothetical protein
MTSNEHKDGLTPKERAAVQFYADRGSDTYNDWCASYKAAGYRTTGKQWKTNAKRTHDKHHIKKAIEEYRARIGKKLDHNRQIAIDLLNRNITWLTPRAEKGDVGAIQALTSAIRELNAISALHSNTVIDGGTTKPTLTDEELEAAKAQAAAAMKVIKLKDIA